MNLLHKYLFNSAITKIARKELKPVMSIEQAQEMRVRIRELLQIKTPAATGVIPTINVGGKDMQNVNINVGNVNSTMASALEKHLQYPRITISTTDINYAEHLINKGMLKEARSVINNLKSVARSIDSQICEHDNYLASLEV